MTHLSKMQKHLSALIWTLFLLAGLSLTAHAAEQQPLILESSKSFTDTVSGIKAAIKKKGLAIIFEANHKNMVEMVGGTETPSLTIGFAKPQMGQKVLSIEPLAGIEMPMRVAIRELKDGKVYVIYYQPSRMFAHYQNPKLDKLGKKMDKMVGSLAKAGTE